jgi:four helix bundle protein
MIRGYRDLLIWQKSHELAKEVIKLCSSFPMTVEASIIKKQMIRSAISVPSNIAEGYGGSKGKVFQNASTIARREATETDYWLLLSYELGFIEHSTHEKMQNAYREVTAMLSSLIKKLEPV